jgi:hypothetical protein
MALYSKTTGRLIRLRKNETKCEKAEFKCCRFESKFTAEASFIKP